MRHSAKRLHAAWRNDHPRRLERPARNRRAHVVGRIHLGRERFDLLARVRSLVKQRPHSPLADDEVRLDVRFAEALQQADAVNDPRCAGNADDDSHWQIPKPHFLGFGSWDLGFGFSMKVLSTECFDDNGPGQ